MRVDVSMVLFHSSTELLHLTLERLFRQTLKPGMVRILLSGGNREDARRIILDCAADDLNRLELLERPDNLGFADGHNYLAQKTFIGTADFLILLNPDVLLDPTALEEFCRSVGNCPAGLAVHGPVLWGASRDDFMRQGSSQDVSIDSAGITWSRDGRHFDKGQGASSWPSGWGTENVEGISGAVLGISRSSWESLIASTGRFLDEMFVAYREDAELGVRVRVTGGACLLHEVDGFVHVRGSRNGVRSSDLQRALSARNRLFLKWCLGSARPGNRVRLLLRDVAVVTAVALNERSSWPAVKRALRVRRAMRYRANVLRLAQTTLER